MKRAGWLMTAFIWAACSNNKAALPASEEGGAFAGLFTETVAPYTLSDTALLNNKDTAQIFSNDFKMAVPDSVVQLLWGRNAKVRYTPLAMVAGKKGEHYYIVKGSSGSKKAALVVAGEANDSLRAALPFLVPDADRGTNQVSTLEINFAINRAINRKLPNDVVQDGKEVYAYSAVNKRFELVLTDPLDGSNLELINPIDTFARTQPFTGDYGTGAKNLISVRDGRKKGLLTVFIHIEKSNGECTGEIKGDARLTGANTAVYNQPGDPCLLQLTFAKNSVIVAEQEGCGSRRSQDCSFNGTYNRKTNKAKAKTE